MDTHKKIREHISTLVDDELSSDDLELAMAALQSSDGQQAMDTYHLIGDVLRSQAGAGLSQDFAQRLGEHLQREPAYGRQKGKAAGTVGKASPRSAGKPPARAADKRTARAGGGDSGNSGHSGNNGNNGHSGAGEPMAPAEAVAATTKPAIASVS